MTTQQHLEHLKARHTETHAGIFAAKLLKVGRMHCPTLGFYRTICKICGEPFPCTTRRLCFDEDR
jgi:hypothetical protein